MSVLIKGMTMPKDCEQCPCSDSYGCAVLSQTMTTKEMKSGRPDWCPLIEIKVPHGDLIDKEVIKQDLSDFYNGIVTARRLIDAQDVVIEAEGAEEK